MKKMILSTITVMLFFIASVTAQPGFGRGMQSGMHRGMQSGMHRGMQSGMHRGMHRGMIGDKAMNNLPGFKFYQMFKADLKLSDKQLEKMGTLDSKFNNDIIDLKAEAQHAGLKMKESTLKVDIDKNTVLSNMDQISNTKNKIAKRVMAYKIDLYNVLTSEQKENSKTLRINMMKERRGNCQGMGMGKPSFERRGSGYRSTGSVK